MTQSRQLREAMVEQLVAAEVMRSPQVRAAFAEVPRELFVAGYAQSHGLAYVYTDQALVTQERNGVPTSSSSQPAVMALMLDALGVRPGHRVLEVGLGTGYNAALLTRLVGETGSVTSIDIDPAVAAKAEEALHSNGYPVTTAVTDGRGGWPAGAPYDRIILTASTESVPYAWWEQLAPNGVLVVPLRLDAMQIIAAFVRGENGFRSRELIPGGFMPLRDEATPESPPAGDSTALVSVRTWLPGKQPDSFSAVGPALARMEPLAVRRLVGHLVLDAARTRCPAVDGVPLLWHTALTSDSRRQIGVHLDFRGLRFGLADLRSGAFSTFAVERIDNRYTLTGIDTFGPDPSGVDELLTHLQRWIDLGSPSMDRLSIEICYTGEPVFPALRTVEYPDQRLCFSWT